MRGPMRNKKRWGCLVQGNQQSGGCAIADQQGISKNGDASTKVKRRKMGMPRSRQLAVWRGRRVEHQSGSLDPVGNPAPPPDCAIAKLKFFSLNGLMARYSNGRYSNDPMIQWSGSQDIESITQRPTKTQTGSRSSPFFYLARLFSRAVLFITALPSANVPSPKDSS
jgi:hypothetical protein